MVRAAAGYEVSSCHANEVGCLGADTAFYLRANLQATGGRLDLRGHRWPATFSADRNGREPGGWPAEAVLTEIPGLFPNLTEVFLGVVPASVDHEHLQPDQPIERSFLATADAGI